MASENGVLAKLVSLRQAFLASVQETRIQFVVKIKEARENYLNQVVDVTLGDPRLSEVERVLGSWTQQVTVVPAPPQPQLPIPREVSPGTAVMLAPPEKQPMKGQKFMAVYRTCPSCNSPIWEPQAKFCSQCAYPLEEL